MIALVAWWIAAQIVLVPHWIGPGAPPSAAVATPLAAAPIPRAAPQAAPAPAPPPTTDYAGSCTRQSPCTGPRGGLYYLTPSGNRVYLRR